MGQTILEYTAVARGQTIQQSPAGSKLGIHIIYYVVPCCTVTQIDALSLEGPINDFTYLCLIRRKGSKAFRCTRRPEHRGQEPTQHVFNVQ